MTELANDLSCELASTFAYPETAGVLKRVKDLKLIIVVQLDRDDPHWSQGPPYIAKEVVFDEHEIAPEAYDASVGLAAH